MTNNVNIPICLNDLVVRSDFKECKSNITRILLCVTREATHAEKANEITYVLTICSIRHCENWSLFALSKSFYRRTLTF